MPCALPLQASWLARNCARPSWSHRHGVWYPLLNPLRWWLEMPGTASPNLFWDLQAQGALAQTSEHRIFQRRAGHGTNIWGALARLRPAKHSRRSSSQTPPWFFLLWAARTETVYRWAHTESLQANSLCGWRSPSGVPMHCDWGYPRILALLWHRLLHSQWLRQLRYVLDR